MSRLFGALLGAVLAVCGNANSGSHVGPGNPSPATANWLSTINFSNDFHWEDGRGWGPSPLSYEVSSAPPNLMNDMLKTIDTVTRLWSALKPSGTYRPLFYRVDPAYTGVPSMIQIRYQDDNYPSMWDVRWEGQWDRPVEIVLHKSFSGKEINWADHRFLFYYLANVIGVDLLRRPISAYPTDITWRPWRNQYQDAFCHIYTARDIADPNMISDPLNSVPVFSSKSNPGFELIVGYDKALAADLAGKDLVFRGVAPMPGSKSQKYEVDVYSYSRSSGATQGYFGWPNPQYGKIGGEFGVSCIDKYAVNMLSNSSRPLLTVYGATEDDPYQPKFAFLNSGHEYSAVSVAMFRGQEANGYQLVFDVPRGAYGCSRQFGLIETMRYLPPNPTW